MRADGTAGIPAKIEAAARQGAARVIASGERPAYRAIRSQNGRWEVLGCPCLSIDAADRQSALEAMRTAVAEWLDVDPETIEVQVD